MSILVEGTLLSPAGHVIGNADIVLTSISTSLVVLGGTPLSVQTDFEGRYSFTLHTGNFAVSVSKDGNNWFSGMITVTDLTVPKSINALILQDAMMAEIPTDYWSYFQSQTGILFNSFGRIDDAVKVTKEARESSLDSRNRAEVAAYRAEQAEVKSDSKTFYITPADPDGTIAGLENTTNGDYFRVSQGLGKDISFIYYRNENGSAVKDTDYPSGTAVNKVVDAIKYDKNGLAFSFCDESGAVFFDGGNDGGYGSPEVRHEHDRLYNQSFEIKQNYFGGLAIQDEQGAIEILSAGFPLANGNTPEPEPPINSLLERDNKNKLASLARQSKQLSFDIAGCIWDYCVILIYGQSLASAMEAWRALTLTPREPGNLLMVGQSVRGRSRTGPYVPLGSNTFTDLKAVVQSTDEPTVVLTADQIASLSPGNLSEGEGFDVGAVHFWRALQLQLKGLPSNPNRKIVLVNCAVAGRSIEELSKGASTGHYDNRVIPALQNIKSLVDTVSPGATCGLMACMYIGNEWNYLGTRGTTDKDEYKSLLSKLFDDITNDANTGSNSIFNVPERPLFITTQTGDVYTRDSTNLSIGTAHIELSNERDNIVCAGPHYHVPSKPGGHRDPNGSRWIGQKIGQVLHNCIDKRLDWFPMQVLSATYTGKEILVDHLVMRYPIVFKDTFSTITPTMYSNKGFRVQDAIGDPNITHVRIAADTIVGMTASRDLVPPVYVWYAGEEIYHGEGNLFDSDSTLSLYKYEYQENSGQYPEANISAYVGKPYQLNNACSAYRIEAIKK